jgi:hypothetical protein
VTAREDVDRLVEYFCCAEKTAVYGPYSPGRQQAMPLRSEELLSGRLFRYRLVDVERRSVDLHVYAGLTSVGGALWDREVRVLLRVGASGLPGLPRVMGGGFQDSDAAARAGVAADGFAVIATQGSSRTLAEEGALDDLRDDKLLALGHLTALADALAEMHDLGIYHRNLWPGTIYTVPNLEQVWIARFEMSVLVADLVRSTLRATPEQRADLRQMFLEQGDPRSLAYSPPERLDFLFPESAGAGQLEGAKGDVYSLGVLAWETFGEAIDADMIPDPADPEPANARVRGQALAKHLLQTVRARRDLPRELAELIGDMLEFEPGNRPTATEVAARLRRHYDTISGYLEDRQIEQAHLVLFMPRESDKTLLPWGLIKHSARTEVGRKELGALIADDMKRAQLVHEPNGAARYTGGNPTDLKESQFVLIGERIAWFCQRYRPVIGRNRLGPPSDEALLIKYVARRLDGPGPVRAKLNELARNPFRREIPEVEVIASDIDDSELSAEMADRPSWAPLLRAVQSITAVDADDVADEEALDVLLQYQGVELRARSYAYECAEPEVDLVEVLWDQRRDRDLITRDALLTNYAESPRLRPALGDFFGRLEDDEGDASVEIVADDRGRLAAKAHRSEWTVVRKTGTDRVLLRRKGGSRINPPKIGWIRPADFHGTRTAIERQAAARWELIDARDLLHQLRSPAAIKTLPHRWASAGSGLVGQGSKQAVRDMLSYQPFYAVQGPPGTGKTTVVAEAVAAQLAAEPATRILISAQSTFALDNLAEKILRRLGAVDDLGEPTRWWDGAALRVTSAQGTRPHGKMSLWLKGQLAERRVDEIRARVADQLADGVDEELRPVLEDWQRLLDGTGGENVLPELEDRLERASNLVFATCATATAEAVTPGGVRSMFDWVIVEEAAKAWPTELALPLARGTRWTLVGDYRQLPAHRRDDFVRFLNSCLNDPDTGLSLLAERKDGVVDMFDTFRRIFQEFESPDLTKEQQGALPLTVLGTQFRMSKPIANVISRVFYPRPGSSPEADGLLPGTLATGSDIRPLPLRSPDFLRGRSLVWLDTTGVPSCATDVPTWSNEGEAVLVADLVAGIDPPPRSQTSEYSAEPLAVLTPYRRQALLLSRHSHVKPHVYTVHAFQGREADIVIVSLVRTTARGSDPAARPWESLGHLSRPDLINVMMSRARRLLVLVGKYEHFAAFTSGEASFWGQVCHAVNLYGTVVPAEALRA